jgi:exodeoxyribonuclease-1
LIAAHRSKKREYPPSPHVERQIYDRFFSEQNLMDAFHAAPWELRPGIVEQFHDERLKTIGWRLIHSERPDVMEADMCRHYDQEVARRITEGGEEVPWLAISKAMIEIDEMIAAVSVTEAILLIEHKQQLARRLNEALQTLSGMATAVA